jgi:hypothetical protein
MKMSQFPFGSRIEKVIQTDKSPKKAFVLGVYAGAVHAKWVDKYGKVIINPIGIASEPEIFWKGNDDYVEYKIDSISMPTGYGRLIKPNKNLNGPSGRS